MIETIRNVRKARQSLADYLRPTPLILCDALSRRCGGRVWLKLESQQPTSSFKVRPAFNGMLTHLEQARRSGVVTSSSGNFAQAVAYAARELGVDAKIVMTRNASAFKIERTKRFGGAVVPCEDTFDARWETTFRIQREEQRVLLHPYDSEETIAADGVIGLELVEALDRDFRVVVPVSGGGLLSGIASAVKAERPGCRVVGVQPAANGSMTKSLEKGERVTVTPGPSLADALIVAAPGERVFPIIQRLVDDVPLVDEAEIAAAVRLLAEEQKLVVEGGGAVGVAALMAGKITADGRDLVCVISGGNILPRTLSEILGDPGGSGA